MRALWATLAACAALFASEARAQTVGSDGVFDVSYTPFDRLGLVGVEWRIPRFSIGHTPLGAGGWLVDASPLSKLSVTQQPDFACATCTGKTDFVFGLNTRAFVGGTVALDEATSAGVEAGLVLGLNYRFLTALFRLAYMSPAWTIARSDSAKVLANGCTVEGAGYMAAAFPQDALLLLGLGHGLRVSATGRVDIGLLYARADFGWDVSLLKGSDDPRRDRDVVDAGHLNVTLGGGGTTFGAGIDFDVAWLSDQAALPGVGRDFGSHHVLMHSMTINGVYTPVSWIRLVFALTFPDYDARYTTFTTMMDWHFYR